MDENTKFLIQRIDRLEERLMNEIKELQGFRNRALGMAGLISLMVTIAVELLYRKLGG